MSDADHSLPRPGHLLRRVIVVVAVACFSVAAVGGIVALLGAELGETAWRILGTTAAIGGFSIGVLCCAALVGRRLQVFGVTGAMVSIVACALAVFEIWYRGPYLSGWEVLNRLTLTGIAASAAFALASLLLLLADRRRPAVRIGLRITIGLFAVVLGLVVYAIWWSNGINPDVYQRLLGVTSILAALGAVVVPVISILMRDGNGTSELSRNSVAMLEAEALRRGLSPDALVERLLGAPVAEDAEVPASAPSASAPHAFPADAGPYPGP